MPPGAGRGSLRGEVSRTDGKRDGEEREEKLGLGLFKNVEFD
jgi:hypothetical protein